MKLTVDSNEPLEDALRVVGALYGVTIVVSDDRVKQSKPNPQRTAQSKPRSASTKARKPAGAPDDGVRTSRTKKSAGSVLAPNNAEVRSWARRTGVTVSERGKVPSSVMAAYRNAHQ